MIAVEYGGHFVAFVDGDQCQLCEAVDGLPTHDPRRRWIAALADFACKVDLGSIAGPFRIERACAYARAALLPTDQFAMRTVYMSDRSLARYFNVPTQEVTIRRAELGLIWNSSSAEVRPARCR